MTFFVVFHGDLLALLLLLLFVGSPILLLWCDYDYCYVTIVDLLLLAARYVQCHSDVDLPRCRLSRPYIVSPDDVTHSFPMLVIVVGLLF